MRKTIIFLLALCWLANFSHSQEPVGAPERYPSPKKDNEPLLRLMLVVGDGPMGSAKCLHGLMRMARGWKTPGLANTTRVDIISAPDNVRIVVLVRDNGPIYSSTNSGMSWTVFNTPGMYKFPLTDSLEHGGFYAAATLYPSPENQTSTNALASTSTSSWYAVGSTPDGNKLVLTGDSSQPAPALSITHSEAGVVVSWSAAFKGFLLQANSDLNSTNWVDVTNSVNVTGEENQVFISSPVNNNYYRLRSQ